jgi:RHS repeat-associated protein
MATSPSASVARSYTLRDGLGSVSAAVSTSGTVTASQLYGPYGAVRYSNGTLPGTLGYTGQHADAVSGLDYYNARSYDPIAGQFTSADTALAAKNDASPTASQLNRYAYVGGNPETRTDPSGHRYTCPAGGCGGDDGGGGTPTSHRPPDGSGVQSLPKGCNYTGFQCQIDAIFHDQRTRNVLMFIANSGSEIGISLLKFLLFVGAQLEHDGYISWHIGGSAATTDNWTGYISISTALYDPNDLRAAATGLIHEAVESYFSIEAGVNLGGMGSQRGDYVAQWFAGEFEKQANDAKPYTYDKDNGPTGTSRDTVYKAYGLTFDQWKQTRDFVGINNVGGYNNEFPIPLELWGGPHGLPTVSGWNIVGYYHIAEVSHKIWDLAGYP